MADTVTAPAVDVKALLKGAAAGVRAQVEGPAQAAANSGAPASAPPSIPAPATPPPGAPPAAPPAAADPPRDDKGRFAPDPNLAAQREVIKRQQTELKALREQVKNRMTAPVPVAPVPSPMDPSAEVIAAMPPETQAWWKAQGEKLVTLKAQAIANAALEPFKPALAAAGSMAAREQEQVEFETNYSDWKADKIGEGDLVNDQAMLTALDEFERRGYRFGKDDPTHFDAVLGLLKTQNPNAAAPILSGKEAEEAAKKEAEAKARAGGMRPGSAYTPPPTNRQAEVAKTLRDASWNGDGNTVAAALRDRLRGINPFEPKAPPE